MKEKPFKSAKAAWFWFMEWSEAGGMGDPALLPKGRPCEPIEILRVLDRLKQDGAVTMDHVLILRKYGRLGRAPDPAKQEQGRAFRLWREALFALEKRLTAQGIVKGESKNGVR